jgi:hypothetical protein
LLVSSHNSLKVILENSQISPETMLRMSLVS